jgi:hypothetical protein
MADEGNGWWKYTVKGAGCGNIIFNNNSAPQTADLLNVCGEKWYNNGFVNAPLARQINSPSILPLKKSYKVYPNPVSNEMVVPIELSKPLPVTIAVFDIDGRVVYKSQARVLQAGTQNIIIERGGISKGTYVVEVTIGDTKQRNTVLFE